MKELENTIGTELDSVLSEVDETIREVDAVNEEINQALKNQRYKNHTARVLHRVYGCGLVLAAIYLLTQIALTFTGYLSQKDQLQAYIAMGQDVSAQASQLTMSLLYTFAGLIMPAAIMFGVCFLFLFFAELIEQLAAKKD